MAGSINWSNYSSAQIMQMQKLGIQVPDDVLASASTTAASGYEIDDEVVRESVDLDLEEFTQSEEFKDASIYEQMGKLGAAQESKYKEAFEAQKAVDEIEQSLSTLSSAINDRATQLDAEICDATDEKEANKIYKQGIKDLQNLASGSSTRADEAKGLYEKAVAAEKYAEAADEKANYYINYRRNLWGALTLGISELFTTKKREEAHHIMDRADTITAATPDMQEKSKSVLSSMQKIAANADDSIRNYTSQVTDDNNEDGDKKFRFLQ
ncbi:hypothetical protein IKE67_03395 [bacterium]|nr:hypothetical protein [bacterium]